MQELQQQFGSVAAASALAQSVARPAAAAAAGVKESKKNCDVSERDDSAVCRRLCRLPFNLVSDNYLRSLISDSHIQDYYGVEHFDRELGARELNTMEGTFSGRLTSSLALRLSSVDSPTRSEGREERAVRLSAAISRT